MSHPNVSTPHALVASYCNYARKGQAAIFNFTGDVKAEARIVEHAFGIGTSMLAEAVALSEQQLNLQPV